jgi:hypothetical protein
MHREQASRGPKKKAAICKPKGVRGSGDATSASTLILDFQSPELETINIWEAGEASQSVVFCYGCPE